MSHDRIATPKDAGFGDVVLLSFIEAVPHGVLVVDSEGRIVASNGAATRLFGHETGAMVGRSIDELVVPAKRAAHVALRASFAEQPSARPLGHRQNLDACRADGSVFLAQVGFSPWMTAAGPMVVVTVVDASMMRVAETEAQEQHVAAVEAGETSRAIIRESPVGIVICEAESGRCVSTNAAAANIVGISEANLRAQNFREIAAWRDSGLLAAAEKVLATGTRRGIEVSMHTSGGKDVTLSCNLMRISLRGHAHLVVMFDDLTQRRNLEAQLRVAQKMEAIGQLAGGVAHDFNNLLTVIGTYTTLMIEDTPDTDERKGDLLEIMGAANRAASLTRQLLAFGRRQLLEAKVLDLNDIVRGLENMLRRVLSAEIDLKLTLEDGLGAVSADSGQIEQVLMNLVVNARDAMPRGGELSIKTANLYADMREHPRMGGTSEYAEPLVMLSVTDTGVGMDAPTLARVFEPFFTTKDPGRGTGLGLSTTYGIIKQSGGHVRARSAPGVGSSFEVLLPRIVAAATQPEHPGAAEGDLRGSGLVLVAEDDDAVRRIVVTALRRFGYEVIEATDGQEAVNIPFAPGAMPVLLVTDVVMPSMSGQMLAAALRERWPKLPVLFTSAYATDGTTGEAASNLPGLLLRKPFVPGELAAAVRNAIAGAGTG